MNPARISPPEKKEGEVVNQIRKLDKMIEELPKTIQALRVKIAPVLKECVPKPLEGGEDHVLVPLAASINRCLHKVMAANEELLGIIELCEL